MVTNLAAFLGVSALVIVTPGQDTLLTIRNTLRGGRAGGVATALGVSSGQAAWALATSLGLAALLAASEPAFTTVKLVGAAYLVYLGVESLLAALRGSKVASTVAGGSSRLGGRAAFRQGFVSNLGNPKMAVFFTSLLPQFTPGAEASFRGLLLLGAIFALLTLAWLSAYAAAVARAGEALRRSGLRRALDGVAGTVLVVLGLRLATQQR